MKIGAIGKLNSHDKNYDLAQEASVLAVQCGMAVVHNSSSARRGPHDGYHRYLILDSAEGSENTSIRSRACISYWETRFSRNYLPSISGERSCLEAMVNKLKEMKK